jgi:PrcB C-terminal
VFSSWSVVAMLSAVCCAAAPADPVTFKTIDRGGQSNIESAREVVVRTAADWTKLWSEHAGGRPRPRVDFTRSMVVGVFLGSRSTGGYSVDITRIEREGSDLVVTYRERKPDPADIVTQVITMPYHLVTTERFAGPIRFARAR